MGGTDSGLEDAFLDPQTLQIMAPNKKRPIKTYPHEKYKFIKLL